MKYKAGDEVLIKAEITDVSGYDCSERPYFVAPDCWSINWVSEDKIIPIGKTYSEGLNDAWELAKRIVMGVEDGGFDSQEVIDVFGKNRYYSFKDLSPQEALAKIEAYEKEKKIKVGDEVVLDDEEKTVFIVTRIRNGFISGFDKDGTTHSYIFPNRFIQKTGKHIDIESLLLQIGE